MIYHEIVDALKRISRKNPNVNSWMNLIPQWLQQHTQYEFRISLTVIGYQIICGVLHTLKKILNANNDCMSVINKTSPFASRFRYFQQCHNIELVTICGVNCVGNVCVQLICHDMSTYLKLTMIIAVLMIYRSQMCEKKKKKLVELKSCNLLWADFKLVCSLDGELVGILILCCGTTVPPLLRFLW